MGLKFHVSPETPRSAFKEPSSLLSTSLLIGGRHACWIIRRSEFKGQFSNDLFVTLAKALPLSGPQLPHVWLGDFERFIKDEMR